jgi:hypothetical protein
MTEPAVEDLPNPAERRRITEPGRAIVLAAVIGGGLALVAVVTGLVILGVTDEQDAQISSTGLSAIGSTLAGGFAGWIARGQVQTHQDTRRRSTDPPGGTDERTGL